MSSETTDTMTNLHSAPAADIEDVRVENEMEQSYIDYAMSVIAGRALPDVRDGLKPVHRRILYAMNEQGITSNSGHRKSSSVVGETMGNFHPHGDSAIYNTLARMAQPFSMRHPLVDGQGNFGSIDGDAPAAMRYTEARLESLGEELLSDIDLKTVDWESNYDDRMEEPTVLPAAFPNLLVNGSSGIAVGMSTNIPPHNLGEIIDALHHLLDNPDADVDALMDHVKGPDFPTGATIVGHDAIEKAYKTGRGRLRVRSKYETNVDEREIVITEIPFQKDKSKLVSRIADLVNDGVIDGVRDLRDESDKDGIRIVVELKRDALIDVVENQLIDNVLEKTFGVINLALVDGQPQVLTLREMLQFYIDHRVDVVTRRTQHLLEEAQNTAHLLKGRLKAVGNAEQIVELIRESDDRKDAIEALQEVFNFDEDQAAHTVRMQLGSLTSMEAESVQEDYQASITEIARLQNILSSDKELRDVIRSELAKIKTSYADERRTEIVPDTGNVSNEDLIPEEDIVVVMTDAGYLKRMNVETFSSQSRGGKGVIGLNLRESDKVNTVFTASTHDRFLVFTNLGNVHSMKGYEMPDMGRMARGTAAVNILNLSDDEQIVELLPETDIGDNEYLVTASANGRVKRTHMEAFENIYSSGIRALTLEDGDALVEVALTDGTSDLMLSTRDGMSIRFSETEVRSMGRTAKGVNGIELATTDTVVGMAVIPAEASEHGLLTVTENGYGKRTSFSKYNSQYRYGKGVIDIKTGNRNGPVAAALSASPDNELMVMTENGQIMRIKVSDISDVSRNTKGVNVMSLDGSDSVVSVAVY